MNNNEIIEGFRKSINEIPAEMRYSSLLLLCSVIVDEIPKAEAAQREAQDRMWNDFLKLLMMIKNSNTDR